MTHMFKSVSSVDTEDPRHVQQHIHYQRTFVGIFDNDAVN